MNILTQINQLPNEIQNHIFYFVIQTEADLIRNIDWVKEYQYVLFKKYFFSKNTFTIYKDVFGNLNQRCIDNGIKKFNKNNRIDMIKKLMKL